MMSDAAIAVAARAPRCADDVAVSEEVATSVAALAFALVASAATARCDCADFDAPGCAGLALARLGPRMRMVVRSYGRERGREREREKESFFSFRKK